MRRFLLPIAILFSIFFQIQSVMAESRTIVTRTPLPYNHPYNYTNSRNPIHYYNGPYHNINRPYNIRRSTSGFSDISALEEYSMNRSFKRESDLERLERLELQAFGAIQQGDIASRYDNVRSAILSRPQQNYKTSLLRNIGNYFAGQMTGFTPSLNSFGSSNPYMTPMSGFTTTNYPTTYGNNSITEYSGPFGGGYRINNFGTGSSAGVRIID